MRVAFRVDASAEIGSGHVMRCLTLAKALRAKGAQTLFVCREHPGHLCHLLESDGFEVARLPTPDPGWTADPSGAAHAPWLGAHWQDDARQTAGAIATRLPALDWLVLDHYAIDERWERELQGAAATIMAIDDLADRRHECSVLLDQNLAPGMADRYEGLLPDGGLRLIGPRYALLMPAYAEWRKGLAPRQGTARRVLIYFGGSDLHGMSLKALQGALVARGPGCAIDVVVPASSPDIAAIQALGSDRPEVTVHTWLPTLAPLMARADLAIGAAGSSSWERLCLGLPSLVVTLAENQRAIAESLHGRGLARYLGHHDQVDAGLIADALAGLVGHAADTAWSQRCLDAVDGLGCERLASLFMSDADDELQVRRAGLQDESLLLDWANDPVTRRYAFSSARISPAEHARWLRARLDDAGHCRFYIVETAAGMPIGSVRFQGAEADWELHFSLARVFRGRGLGKRLVSVAISAFAVETPECRRLAGRVLEGNAASVAIFAGLGFDFRGIVEPGTLLFDRRM